MSKDIHQQIAKLREHVNELHQEGRYEEALDLAEKTCKENEYYQIGFDTDFSITEDNVTGQLHEQMLDSVRRNLISDAPLGLTHSGGFDTSSMLTLVKGGGR